MINIAIGLLRINDNLVVVVKKEPIVELKMQKTLEASPYKFQEELTINTNTIHNNLQLNDKKFVEDEEILKEKHAEIQNVVKEAIALPLDTPLSIVHMLKNEDEATQEVNNSTIVVEETQPSDNLVIDFEEIQVQGGYTKVETIDETEQLDLITSNTSATMDTEEIPNPKKDNIGSF
jgi:hypothetical protein